MNTNNSLEMEYSWTVQEWWNETGSYDRLQFSWNFSSQNEIIDFLNDEALNKFNNSQRSRLDIRWKVENIINQDIKELQEKFPSIELSHLYNQNYSEIVEEIIIWKNKEERAIWTDAEKIVQSYSHLKLEELQNIDINNLARFSLEQMQNLWYQFETERFSAQELFELWWDNFGWSLEQAELYTNNDREDEKIFGIRDSRDGHLAAAILISHWESTEWAVEKNYQWQGAIIPLLFYSNIWWLQNNPETNLQVFARYNRSVSPAIKTGFAFPKENIAGILTNHVDVWETETPDSWNIWKNNFWDTNWEHLRSFAIWQLQSENISQEIQDLYLNSNL